MAKNNSGVYWALWFVPEGFWYPRDDAPMLCLSKAAALREVEEIYSECEGGGKAAMREGLMQIKKVALIVAEPAP